MRKITLKFFIKKFVRESLVIFWNLLLVFANHDFNILKETNLPADLASNELMNKMQLFSDNIKFILEKDKTKTQRITENYVERFLYLIQFGAPAFSITVIPCNSQIYWSLYFRNVNDTGEAYNSHYRGNLLMEYNGTETQSYFTDTTDLGLYTIEVTALYEETTVIMFPSEDKGGPRLLSLKDNDEAPRHITVKFKFKFNSTFIKWPKIFPKADFTNEYFVIVVSKTKYCKTICLPIIDEEFQLDTVSNYRREYTITNMTYGEQYYVNIFLKDNTEFWVPYAKTNFIYQKQKPKGLRDGKLIRGNLKYNAGKLSYKYKVTNRLLPEPKLMWHVISCKGKVNVEIKHKKKILLNEIVYNYKNFTIKNPINGDRYVIKVTDANENKNSQVEFIEILATTNFKLNPLPNFPENLSVKEYSKQNKCHSKEMFTTIYWLPIISEEPIIYCVNVIELSYNDSFKFTDLNQCNLDLISSAARRISECFQKSSVISGKPFTQKLRLKQDRNYVIQVTARKHNKQATVSYNLLRISKNKSCTLNDEVQ